MVTYTWHGRFSDGSTDNTSRGRLWLGRHHIEVAGMAGISKYTAQYTLKSDLSMSHVNARLNVRNFYSTYLSH